MIKIVKDSLANGLDVFTDTVEGHHSVSVKLWVKSGSRSESKVNNGIAHFLEHMAFKGTKTRSALQIAKELDELGGNFNAYTSREYTIYYIKVLNQFIEKAIEILADITLNSVFLKEEIEREKSVVLEEIAQTEDSPDDIIFDKFFEAIYPDQPFGRSILGTKQNVQSFTSKDLKDFIDDHYFSENMMLIASGGVSHQKILDCAKKYLSGLKSKKTPITYQKPEYFCGNFRQNKKLEQTHFVLGFPSVSYQSPLKKVYSVKLLSVILGGGMSSRLFQEVREKRGLAYGVSAFCSVSADCGAFCVYSSTDPKNLNELIGVTLSEIGKLAVNITKEELTRAKNQAKSSILMSAESNESRANYIGKFLQYFGRLIAEEELISVIDSLEVSDINLAAEETFAAKKLGLAAIGETDLLPNNDELINKIYV